VAGIAAARIARLAPRPVLSGVLVPVPGARLRTMARGIDPPAEIARALSARTGMAVVPCLRRRGGRRQLGRRRTERLARPPKVELRSPAPASALLVDDVLTTGATLSACARALRGGGGLRVAAVTFARRL
jgi:predicted amidophosphoribosyltransferase